MVTSLLLIWALGSSWTTTIVPVTPWKVPVPPVIWKVDIEVLAETCPRSASARIIEPPMATWAWQTRRTCSCCPIRTARGLKLSSLPRVVHMVTDVVEVRPFDGIARDRCSFGGTKGLPRRRQENLALEFREVMQDLLGVGLHNGRVSFHERGADGYRRSRRGQKTTAKAENCPTVPVS